MIARCTSTSGADLRPYEFNELGREELGRFGSTSMTTFGVEIGKDYLVMGVLTFQSHVSYLVDDGGVVQAIPVYLFTLIDNKIPGGWKFRITRPDEVIYPYVQAILGYQELCDDLNSYMRLIIDVDEEARVTYFNRKIEAECGHDLGRGGVV